MLLRMPNASSHSGRFVCAVSIIVTRYWGSTRARK